MMPISLDVHVQDQVAVVLEVLLLLLLLLRRLLLGRQEATVLLDRFQILETALMDQQVQDRPMKLESQAPVAVGRQPGLFAHKHLGLRAETQIRQRLHRRIL